MTDELRREILQLIKDHLTIEIKKDGDYYGNYTYNVSLSLYDDDTTKYEQFSWSYD